MDGSVSAGAGIEDIVGEALLLTASIKAFSQGRVCRPASPLDLRILVYGDPSDWGAVAQIGEGGPTVGFCADNVLWVAPAWRRRGVGTTLAVVAETVRGGPATAHRDARFSPEGWRVQERVADRRTRPDVPFPA